MVVLGADDDYEGINRSELTRVYEFARSAKNYTDLEKKYHNLFIKHLEVETNESTREY